MAGKRVLVVDDDPDTVVYLTSFLEDHGYEIRSAPDAASALGTLASYRPDIILIDVLLPGRSGLDLLVTVRRDARLQDAALVVITGMDEILKYDCRSHLISHEGVAGPDAVLGKPIDAAALLSLVGKLVGPPTPTAAG